MSCPWRPVPGKRRAPSLLPVSLLPLPLRRPVRLLRPARRATSAASGLPVPVRPPAVAPPRFPIRARRHIQSTICVSSSSVLLGFAANVGAGIHPDNQNGRIARFRRRMPRLTRHASCACTPGGQPQPPFPSVVPLKCLLRMCALLVCDHQITRLRCEIRPSVSFRSLCRALCRGFPDRGVSFCRTVCFCLLCKIHGRSPLILRASSRWFEGCKRPIFLRIEAACFLLNNLYYLKTVIYSFDNSLSLLFRPLECKKWTHLFVRKENNFYFCSGVVYEHSIYFQCILLIFIDFICTYTLFRMIGQ